MIENDCQLIQAEKNNCSWPISYGLVTDLAKSVHAKTVLEVGVAYGYHAEYLLETLPSISYTGVDPYLASYDLNDPFGQDVQRIFGESTQRNTLDRISKFIDRKISKFIGRNTSIIREALTSFPNQQSALDRLHRAVEWKLLQSNRAKLIRNKSVDAAALVPDNSLDLVYIDGDHTYDAVISDMNAWWNKVDHQRGLICGDDYCWPGVKLACDDFFKDKKLSYSLAFKKGSEDYPIWYYDFSKLNK
jgi:23S rRNA U2552 (ribose-2'-O)-methylase RlmE/FtsJ